MRKTSLSLLRCAIDIHSPMLSMIASMDKEQRYCCAMTKHGASGEDDDDKSSDDEEDGEEHVPRAH